MAERDQQRNQQQAIEKGFYQRASTAEGFRILLNEHDVLSMQIAGREVTLFVKPETTPPQTAPNEGLLAADAEPEGGSQDAAERANRRLRFSGRLASDPHHSTLPRRGLRVGFVVAEHDEEGEVTFHRTYATGEYARRIQHKAPHKGDEVTIDGERQVNRIRQTDGTFKESPLVFCYGLRVRTSPPRRNG